eukprot:3092128-Amphidinium_carterae.1
MQTLQQLKVNLQSTQQEQQTQPKAQPQWKQPEPQAKQLAWQNSAATQLHQTYRPKAPPKAHWQLPQQHQESVNEAQAEVVQEPRPMAKPHPPMTQAALDSQPVLVFAKQQRPPAPGHPVVRHADPKNPLRSPLQQCSLPKSTSL